MDEKKWLQERKSGIGGSDVGAILGFSPYKTAVDVFFEKVENFQKEASNEMNIGKKIEPFIAELYAEQTGEKIIPVGYDLWRHPEYEWMIGTPDFITDTKGKDEKIIEIKNIGAYNAKEWGEQKTDDVPLHYLAQVNQYMILKNYHQADLAVLIGGNDFRIYNVKRDEELVQLIIEEEERFWKDHILTKKMPDIEGSRYAKEYLDQKYAKNTLPLRDPEEDEIEKINLFFKTSIEYKESEEKYETLKTIIKSLIGENEGIKTEYGNIKWSFCKGKKYIDYEKIIAELIDNCNIDEKIIKVLKDKHTNTGKGFRRLSLPRNLKDKINKKEEENGTESK